MSLSTMRRINIDNALYSPSEEDLTTLLSILCSDGRLWKLGSCFEDRLDNRPFSTQHYNTTWFDTKGAMCVAYGITTKDRAKALESAGIQHLKHTLHIGVNVKDTDDVPHDAICDARPQALYIVPAVRTIATQAQFKDEHLSEYKLKLPGLLKTVHEREAAGLPLYAPESAPRTYHRAPGAHNGGKQPTEHVRMDDDDFVSGLIDSGIPLAELDRAFAAGSFGRFNKMLAMYWKVLYVACELSLLFGGKNIRNDKFMRIKPIYAHARKSGAQSSSATLPLDATEPRFELELVSADNLMAIV
jgi:hypothetical protein